MEIKGRDLMNGVPKEIVISERQIAESLAEPVGADRRGGQGRARAHRAGTRRRHRRQGHRADRRRRAARAISTIVLRHATGLPVSIADDPLSCVALGTGRALEEMKTLKNVLISMY